jgi:hypothetical protein
MKTTNQEDMSMTTAWKTRDCPKCGWGPYDRVEETCPNPRCENHSSRLIDDPVAREGNRQAAIDNLRRRP